MKKLTVSEIEKATGGELIAGSGETAVSGVEMDSRIMKDGDCFFALSGERSDGNDYIEAAFANGAVCAVVSDRAKAETAAAKFEGRAAVLVDDTEKALRGLAKYYIEKFDIIKIAVTGSNGKTTTKDMIHSILAVKYRTHKTPVNRNNLIGLPLTVLALPEDTEAAVFEMGMDTFDEIHKMADIVRPDIAVITNVGVSHIESLGSREGILKAKLEITDFLKEDDTLIIWDGGDILTRRSAEGNYRLLSAGNGGKSDFIISDIVSKGEEGSEFTLEYGGRMEKFALGVPGEHNVINASLAIAAAHTAGVSADEIRKGLLDLKTEDKRMNIRGANGIKVIDDTYNASPPAVRAAIDVLMSTKGVRKLAILGDMLDLGEESDEFHREAGRYAGKSGVEFVVGIGEKSRFTCMGAAEYIGKENVMYFAQKDEFFEIMRDVVKPGDVILVKGSRGMAMETVVKKILE